MNDLLTLAEAAATLRCCEKTVRKYVAAGKLPAVRRLGRVLVRRADIEALHNGQQVEPVTAAAAG